MTDAIESTRRADALHARPPLPALQAAPAPAPGRLKAVWARHQDEVRAAQALRFRVFALEMGARLQPAGAALGLDIDPFDDHCEHLLVKTTGDDEGAEAVVGTYRVMTPDGARRAGGWYSQTEFDLQALQSHAHRVAELGRSCTDAAWREGAVILLLWRSLGAFMQRNGLQLMLGCASVPMRDGGHHAASLWRQLSRTHLASPDRQVKPRLPLPVEQLRCDLPAEAPALIKGYLRCGAKLLGPPAWDPDFGVADLPMMLDLDELGPAARQRLIRG